MSEERSFRPRPRIESLSDLIFGLALSIGALTLIGQQPATFEALVAALGLYGFSFLILVRVWHSYSSITSVLPAETEVLVSLNIILLFIVSVEPYLFNQLFSGDMFHSVSIIYAVDLAAMFLILAFLNHALADESTNRVPKSYLRKYRLNRNYDLFIAAIFLVSIVPIFESINVLQITVGNAPFALPLRVFIWILALFSGLGRRLLGRVTKT